LFFSSKEVPVRVLLQESYGVQGGGACPTLRGAY